MSVRRLEVAVARSDRVFPLIDGGVSPPGLEFEFATAAPSAIFWRVLHSDAYDVAEMSLAAHCILTSRGDRRFVGLPVITSRMFRHNAVYVRADSPLTDFASLAGRRVGVPEYQMTAAVWVRGLMAEQHGVDLRSIHWHVGGVEQPGRKERIELRLPPDYRVTPIGEDRTLAQMLAEGAIDAYVSTSVPQALGAPGGVRRLIVDYRSAEQRYFAEQAIFPAMHLLVMRREIHEAEPGLAAAVYDAFAAAKEVSMHRLRDTDTLAVMLPWLNDDAQTVRRVMGEDYWPYGIRGNERCLNTFLRLLGEQQLLAAPVTVADLFAPELLAT